MPELDVAPVFSDESGRRAAAVQWAGRSVTAGALTTLVALAVILSTSSVPLPRLPEPWSPPKAPSGVQGSSHAGGLPEAVAVPDPGPAARVRALAAVQAVATVPTRKTKATKAPARTARSNANDAVAAGTGSRAVPAQSRRASASTGAPVQADASPRARRPRTAPASPPPAPPVAPAPPRDAPSDKAPRPETPREGKPRTRTPASARPPASRPPASRPVGASRRPPVQPAPSARREQPAKPGPNDRAAKDRPDDGAAEPVPGPPNRRNS